MSGVFGILNRDGRPLDPGRLSVLHQGMAQWGQGPLRCDGPFGAGALSSPRQPAGATPTVTASTAPIFVAAGRIDNRAELSAELVSHWAIAPGRAMRN